MAMTDPIADMLSRIRNANSVFHDKVEIPASNIKSAIADVLRLEGFIKDYTFAQDNKQGILTIFLKYGTIVKKLGDGNMVQNLGKLSIQNIDGNGSSNTEVIGYVDGLVNTSDTTLANSLNTATRAINRLTTNSYVDAIVSYEYSIKEILDSEDD